MHGLERTTLLVLMLLLRAGAALACSCEEPSPGRVIFVGTVQEIEKRVTESGIAENFVRFRVDEDVRDAPDGEAIVVTDADGAACGFDFVDDRPYEVHARPIEGVLHTGLCTCTGPVGALPPCGGSGCAVTPGRASSAGGGLLGGLVLFVLRRRRADTSKSTRSSATRDFSVR